jgi:enoyl-CoA hydratase/carnithine racemase
MVPAQRFRFDDGSVQEEFGRETVYNRDKRSPIIIVCAIDGYTMEGESVKYPNPLMRGMGL